MPDSSEVVLGFGYLLLGAVCGGSFGLPSKFAPKDTPWETLWGPFFLIVTVAMPLLLGPVLVKEFFAIYQHVGIEKLVLPLVFGLLWGAGSMTLGMSFSRIGLSLAYSLNYGSQIVFGALAPLVLQHADAVFTAKGGMILAGVAVCVAGVAVCGRAGILKERSLVKAESEADAAGSAPRAKALAGLTLAVLSGMLCACYGLAADYTGPVSQVATNHFGNEPWQASCATTALILWGGAFSSCLYCAFQLTRNGTWKNFGSRSSRVVLLVALVMAFLHNGAIYLFNLGFPRLGDLGVPVGYPSFMSFAIIVGNLHGFRTGEWRGASRQSIAWILAGIVTLVVGVCVLAQGLVGGY